jgi:hypothetical protein
MAADLQALPAGNNPRTLARATTDGRIEALMTKTARFMVLNFLSSD